jgi:protein-tyrosine phosphatase
MNVIFSYLSSFIRIIPLKARDTLYNYYYGIRAVPAIRMETIPRIHSIINHITSLGMQPTEIIPGIFLGNAYNANNAQTLESYKISSIINVSMEIPNSFDSKYVYYRIPIMDDNHHHIIDYIPDLLRFFDETRIDPEHALLIHCYMGSSRSASIVLLYLIMKCNYTFDAALTLIKAKRPIVNINTNFLEDIKTYIAQNGVVLQNLPPKQPVEIAICLE